MMIWLATLGHTLYVAVAFPAENARRLLWGALHHALLNLPPDHRLVGWAQWQRRGAEYRYSQIAHDAALHAAVSLELLALGLLLFLLLWKPLWLLCTRVGELRTSGAHGSARFATRREVWRLRLRRGQALFVLGRVGRRWVGLPPKAQYENCLIIGPPGTGKSSGLIIPNLLRETGGGRAARSLIITDPKGEAWDLTSAHLAQTHDVLRLDFTTPEGAGYNPLALIREPLDALAFAQAWVTNTGESGSEPFWDNTAQLLLAAAAQHLLAIHAPRVPSLSELADFLCTRTPEEVKEDLIHSSSTQAQECADGFLSYVQKNERLLGSIFSGLPLRFGCLQDHRVRAVTAHNDVDPALMGVTTSGRPQTLYVVLTPGMEAVFKPLTGTLFTQIFLGLAAQARQSTRGALPRRVLCYLDEAGTIGHITGLPRWLATLRAAGVGCVVAVQSLSQLTALYGRDDAATLRTSCLTTVALAGIGALDAVEISKALGTATVAQHNAAGTRDRTALLPKQGTAGATETGRPLLTADEVTRLPGLHCVALLGNHAPLRVRLVPYFADRRLCRLTGMAQVATVVADARDAGAPRGAGTPVLGRHEATPPGTPVQPRPVHDIDWTLVE